MYRDERAVEYFEAAVAVARAIKRHNPESTSAIPSVMVEVVPRMIKLYGCQLKLGSDVSECHVPGSKHWARPTFLFDVGDLFFISHLFLLGLGYISGNSLFWKFSSL